MRAFFFEYFGYFPIKFVSLNCSLLIVLLYRLIIYLYLFINIFLKFQIYSTIRNFNRNNRVQNRKVETVADAAFYAGVRTGFTGVIQLPVIFIKLEEDGT